VKKEILFSNYWDPVEDLDYTISLMPGIKDGINGSCMGGYIIGMTNYIEDNNKKAAAEVIKYLTSEDVQKKVIVKKTKTFTGLTTLYDDEEVCSIINCSLLKNIQGINRPITEVDNYSYYSEKIFKIINNKLFNDTFSTEEILSEIVDITRIYYFSIKTPIGLITFILVLIVFYLIIFSAILIFIPTYKKHFKFFSLDMWIIYIAGSLILILSHIVYFGKMTILKCNFNHWTIITGSVMVYIPIFYRLIINFPRFNKYSEFIKKYKLDCSLFIILIVIVLNVLMYFVSPFQVSNIILENDKNFAICKNYSKFGVFIIYLQYFIIDCIFLAILVLLFLEWNIKETSYEIRTLAVIMIINGINVVLLIIVMTTNVKNYILYYFSRICFGLVLSFMNHTYLFFIRFWFILRSNNAKEEKKIIKNLLQLNDFSGESTTGDNDLSDLVNTRKKSKSSNSILLTLHYTTEMKK